MSIAGNRCIYRAAIVLVVLLLIGFALSPRYLAYADPPGKADIIIQFVGSEQDTRFREAAQLAREGHADYVFVPTLFSLLRTNQDRRVLSSIWFKDIKPGIDLPGSRSLKEKGPVYFPNIKRAYRFPLYYEDTHAEVLLAKKAMDVCGFKKAIFVSSPYHMRRIKIIASRVFDSSYDIKLMPSRFEKSFEVPLLSRKDALHVITEFSKISWFLCYGLVDRWIRVNQ